MRGWRAVRAWLLAQGSYFALTGLWPLVSLRTFELVSGSKTDDWLVRTVGALALVIGIVLLLAARRPEPPFEVIALAGMSAAAFTAIDAIYALNGTIRRIYLADALLEIVFVGAAILAWGRRRP